MADSDSTNSWLHADPADWIGLGVGVLAAIITKGATLSASGEASEATEAAENAVNVYLGIKGATPGVVVGAATDGKDGLEREVIAGVIGYAAAGATDSLLTSLAITAGVALGAAPLAIVAASAIAAGYVVSKYVSSEIAENDKIASDEAKASAAAAIDTSGTGPISNRQFTTDDGSLITLQADGSSSIQTSLGTYGYDAHGNPLSFTDTSGISLNYDSSTGLITGSETTNPLSVQLTIGADGIQITDQNTGVNAGTLSVDSTGSFQLSQPGAGTLTVPNAQSDQGISVTKVNDDGTTTTTTMSAGGNSIATTETNAGGNVVLTSITDISSGTGQSTTSFIDADGNSLGSLQTTRTVDSNSTTDVSAQLDANGLLIGTTTTVTNADGSSDFISKDSQGNPLSEQVTASDGSAVSTTYNSLTDPSLNSTVTTDSNGNVVSTSSTISDDMPGSYVTSTLGSDGSLQEVETKTSGVDGITDYQQLYSNGTEYQSTFIAADGSINYTSYNPYDPKSSYSEQYDDNGNLESSSNTQQNYSDGSYVTTNSDASGQTTSTLTRYTDGSTSKTAFNNSEDPNLTTTTVTDAQGNLESTTSTTGGSDGSYLTTVSNGNGVITETDQIAVSSNDQGGVNESILRYDGSGNYIGSQTVENAGQENQLVSKYDDSGNLTSTIQSGYQTVQTDYNNPSDPNLTTVTTTNYDGSVASMQETIAGTNPGDYISNTYDGSGSLLREVDSAADGSSIVIDHDQGDSGTYKTYIDANGQTTSTQSTSVSADGATTVNTSDYVSGLGSSVVTQADGSYVNTSYSMDDIAESTVSSYGTDGSLISTQKTIIDGEQAGDYQITTTDGSGKLTSTEDISVTGNAAGGITQTDSITNSDGQLTYQSVFSTDLYGQLTESITNADPDSGTSVTNTFNSSFQQVSERDVNADGSSQLVTYNDFTNSDLTTTSQFDSNGQETSQDQIQLAPDGSGLTSTTTTYTDASDPEVNSVVQVGSDGAVIYSSETTATDGGYFTTTLDGQGQLVGTESTKDSIFSGVGAVPTSAIESQSYNANGDLVSTQYTLSNGSVETYTYPDPSDTNIRNGELQAANGFVEQTSSTVYDPDSNAYITTNLMSEGDISSTSYTTLSNGDGGISSVTNTFDPSGGLISTTTTSAVDGSIEQERFQDGNNYEITSISTDGTLTDTHYIDESDRNIQTTSVTSADGSQVSTSDTYAGADPGSYHTVEDIPNSGGGTSTQIFTDTAADNSSVQVVQTDYGRDITTTDKDSDGNVYQVATQTPIADGDQIVTKDGSGGVLTIETDTSNAGGSTQLVVDAGGSQLSKVDFDNETGTASYYHSDDFVYQTVNDNTTTVYNSRDDLNLTTVTNQFGSQESEVEVTTAAPYAGGYITSYTDNNVDVDSTLVGYSARAADGSSIELNFEPDGSADISYFDSNGVEDHPEVHGADIADPVAYLNSNFNTDGSGNFFSTDGDGGDGGGDDSGDPIILNLSGNEVSTSSLNNSNVVFDMLNDGGLEKTAWVTAGEGVLVYNEKVSGQVQSDSDLVQSFAELKTLDSNQDGKLSASDSAWSQLKVWVDAAGTGQFSTGSIYSLDQLGINSITVNSIATHIDNNGNTIVDQSTFTKNDGSTGAIDGVSLVFTSPSASVISTANHADQLVAAMSAYNGQSQASALTPNEDPTHSHPMLIAASS